MNLSKTLINMFYSLKLNAVDKAYDYGFYKNGFSFVETISENKKRYSKRQIHNAERVGAFIETIGNPSEKDLRVLVRSGTILNCPITIEDVDIYYKIYKKNTLALKGNTTRKKPEIQSSSVIKVPAWILDKHIIVTLYCDIYFVSKISFLGSVAKDLIVRMTQHISDHKKGTIFQACERMVRQYRLRGFIVKYIWADNEFEPLRGDLLAIGVTLHICAANEHVSFMERDVRTVKQRYRAIRHSLPYVTMSSLMVVHLVMFVYFWLNAFPPKNGVSD